MPTRQSMMDQDLITARMVRTEPEPGSMVPAPTFYAQIDGKAVQIGFKPTDLAKALGISPHTFRQMLVQGRGPLVIKLSGERRPHLLIPLWAAEKWAREQAKPYEPGEAGWHMTLHRQGHQHGQEEP